MKVLVLCSDVRFLLLVFLQTDVLTGQMHDLKERNFGILI